MMKRTNYLPLCSLALASLAVLIIPQAQAGCGCPSDRNGSPKTSSITFGESRPDAANLSIRPNALGDNNIAGFASRSYRAEDVEVTLYQDGTVVRWTIRAPGKTY